jgi:hypothetical protein
VTHAFAEEIVFAAAALRRGEIVAYPTETYYGLGVNALDELALARLKLLKGRGDKATSVLVLGSEMIDRLCRRCRCWRSRSWNATGRARYHRAAGAAQAAAADRLDGCVAMRESSHRRRGRWWRASVRRCRYQRQPGGHCRHLGGAVEEAFDGRCRVLHGGDAWRAPARWSAFVVIVSRSFDEARPRLTFDRDPQGPAPKMSSARQAALHSTRST